MSKNSDFCASCSDSSNIENTNFCRWCYHCDDCNSCICKLPNRNIFLDEIKYDLF